MLESITAGALGGHSRQRTVSATTSPVWMTSLSHFQNSMEPIDCSDQNYYSNHHPRDHQTGCDIALEFCNQSVPQMLSPLIEIISSAAEETSSSPETVSLVTEVASPLLETVSPLVEMMSPVMETASPLTDTLFSVVGTVSSEMESTLVATVATSPAAEIVSASANILLSPSNSVPSPDREENLGVKRLYEKSAACLVGLSSTENLKNQNRRLYVCKSLPSNLFRR